MKFLLLNNSTIFDDEKKIWLHEKHFNCSFNSYHFKSASAHNIITTILSARETSTGTIQLYQDNKVISAEASGFDNTGIKNDDFSEVHNFYPDQKLLKLYSRNKRDTSTEYDYFNSKNLVTTVSDSTASFVSTTTYTYDDRNNPLAIENIVSDPNDSVYVDEVHQWFYNADGKPLRMLRVVNKNDSTDIHFTLDDKGNVVEELPFIHKISREKTYYYYDDQNRLTDIVRYNVKAQRLLPDYMFDILTRTR